MRCGGEGCQSCGWRCGSTRWTNWDSVRGMRSGWHGCRSGRWYASTGTSTRHTPRTGGVRGVRRVLILALILILVGKRRCASIESLRRRTESLLTAWWTLGLDRRWIWWVAGRSWTWTSASTDARSGDYRCSPTGSSCGSGSRSRQRLDTRQNRRVDKVEEEHSLEEGVCELGLLTQELAGLIRVCLDK